jgi:site-specific DNA recombinase
MNDNYSRDISVKVRSQLQVKRKHGDFICPFAPYGYQKCEGNHNRIEPDPYAATVVQDIFNWKIQGMTNNGIAIRLAESGILAPLEYKRHKGEPLFSGFKMKERCEWTAQAVARILTNPIYIGTLRQGLRRRPNYKIKKSIPTEENEWVVIHDAHEPVVTKRTFYLAQKALLIDTRAAPRATTVYPLSGLLECGECGNAVTRSTINNGYKLYSYFRCSVRTKEDRCELKQVPEAQVEAAVLQLLQEHISAVVELDRCLSEIQQVPYQKINVAKCEQRREKLAAEIARYRELKASLYEDMKEGLISKTDFCDIRGQYDVRIADALIAQEQIDRELSIYLSGEQSPNNWMKTFTEHRGLKSLTRAVVLECIEKVVIHKDEKLEIIFEHSEDYARLVSSLQEYAARGILEEAM